MYRQTRAAKRLERQLFKLRFTSRQMQGEAKRCLKRYDQEKRKAFRCMQRGVLDAAKIHAENAIRNQSQRTQMLRMSSRIDAVAERVQVAIRMNQLTAAMAGVVAMMERTTRSNNLYQIALTMEQFEQQFSELDLKSDLMVKATEQSTAMYTPEDQVEELIQQVADEHHLDLQVQFAELAPESAGSSAAAAHGKLESQQQLYRSQQQELAALSAARALPSVPNHQSSGAASSSGRGGGGGDKDDGSDDDGGGGHFEGPLISF